MSVSCISRIVKSWMVKSPQVRIHEPFPLIMLFYDKHKLKSQNTVLSFANTTYDFFSLKDTFPFKLQISLTKRICWTVSLMGLTINDSDSVKNVHLGVCKEAKLQLEIKNQYLKV